MNPFKLIAMGSFVGIAFVVPLRSYETPVAGYSFLMAQMEAPRVALPENLTPGPAEFFIAQPLEATSAHTVYVATHPALSNKLNVNASNNLKGFQEIFDHMDQNHAGAPSKLVFPPGVYRIQVKSKNDFVIKNKNHFTLDGNNATLVFSYTTPADGKNVELFLFNILTCLNTKVMNLNVDWDWETYPIASTVEVTGIGPNQTHIRFKVYDFNPARKSQLSTYNSLYSDFLPFDNNRGSVGVQWVNGLPTSSDAVMTRRWGSPVEKIFFEDSTSWQNDEVTLTPLPEKRTWVRDMVRVGFQYLVRHYVYTSTAIALNANTNLTLSNVTVYSAPGMGLGAKGKGHHIWLKHFRIVNKPGTCGQRPCTAAADGINFGSTLGFLKVEDGVIENNLDDGINLHDFLHRSVAYTPGTRNLSLTNYQPRAPFEVGDNIEFCLPDFRPLSPPFVTGILSKSGPTNKVLVLEVNSNLPALPGTALSNIYVLNRAYHTGNFIIRNTSISGNKGRGIILQCNYGLVENCAISFNRKHGLSLDVEGGEQGEGFGPRNMVIRNNLFEYNNIETVWCQHRQSPAIRLGATTGDLWKSAPELTWGVLKNILIMSNVIKAFPGVAIQVQSSETVYILENVIQNATRLPRPGSNFNGSILVNYGSNIQVINNRWYGTFNLQNRGLFYNTELVPPGGILFQGNSISATNGSWEKDICKLSLRGLPPNASRTLQIVLRTGNDGGIFQIDDDGGLLNHPAPIDTYSAEEGRLTRHVGFITPAQTDCEMKVIFTCVGKNAASQNYLLKRYDNSTNSGAFRLQVL